MIPVPDVTTPRNSLRSHRKTNRGITAVCSVMSKSTFHKLAKSQQLIDRFGIAAETPTQVILINHP